MSQVEIVNNKDEIIGIASREDAHAKGLLHRLSVIYVENDNDEILVQIRAKGSGRFDHSSCGHVDVGESYLAGAKRELSEELGIENVELVEVGFGFCSEVSVKNEDGNDIKRPMHIFHVFVCKGEPVKVDPTEIIEMFWSKPEDMLKKMETEPEAFQSGFKASLPVYMKWKSRL